MGLPTKSGRSSENYAADLHVLPQRHFRLTHQRNDLLCTMSLLHNESFPALRVGRILSCFLDQVSERAPSMVWRGFSRDGFATAGLRSF